MNLYESFKSKLNESVYYIGPKEYAMVQPNDENSDLICMYLDDNCYDQTVIPKGWSEDKIRYMAGLISNQEGPRGDRDLVKEVEDHFKNVEKGSYKLADLKDPYHVFEPYYEKNPLPAPGEALFKNYDFSDFIDATQAYYGLNDRREALNFLHDNFEKLDSIIISNIANYGDLPAISSTLPGGTGFMNESDESVSLNK